MTPTALLRAAVAPLLATAIGVTAFGVTALGVTAQGVGTPAQATPGPADAVPVRAQAPEDPTSPDDDATDADRPVQIDVGRFEPRAITPGATVTVTGTLTNEGAAAISGLSIRMQRGDVLSTRAELAAEIQDPDPATAVQPPFEPVPGELSPGGELEFSYTIASELLRLDRDGVYPVLLNINGAVEGDQQRRVGELSTYLVQQPVDPAARTAVAWMWPLVARTHRGPTGAFLDDGLTDLVARNGRLDRALGVLERLPAALPPGAGEPVPTVLVTLAIDPALVEELAIMAAGPYDVAGQDDAGRGTEEAAAFLERLTAVADVHPVFALPYGDVDADALAAAGLGDVLARTLAAVGTAQDPTGAEAGNATPSATPTDAGPVDDGEDDSGAAAGAAILAEVLDAEPRTDLAWAVGGTVTPAALATLRAGGVEQVVVGTGGVSRGDALAGLTAGAASAHATVSTVTGPLDVLVADATLGEIVGSAEQVPGGARLAEQRYLAELALLSMQAPAGSVPTVLVAAPRGAEADLEGVGAMMADTAGLPWLRAATVAELAATSAADGGELLSPLDAATLDPAGMADVAASVGIRNALADAVVGDADTALRAYDAAIARTVSASWRSDPEAFRAAAADLRAALEGLRGQVTLLAPADGTYSLGSTDAPLVLTVRNDLPVAIEVRLEVGARGARAISVADIGVQTLAPGQRTTLQVPIEVRQSGGFAVTAQLTTPGGAPLGDRIQLQVKSTTYGSISLLITFGAAGLLALLFLRRLVLFVLRRRRATAARGGAAGSEWPADAPAQPPNRSPV